MYKKSSRKGKDEQLSEDETNIDMREYDNEVLKVMHLV
jgi:hypothetical protein